MGTVQFDPADGSVRMHRDTNLPGVQSTTVVIVAKVTSYEDFFALVSLLSGGGNATEIWGDASGDVNAELDFGGAIELANGETGWFCAAFVLSANGGVTDMATRYRVFGGTSAAGGTDTEGVNNFSRIRIGANDTFLTDMEGQFRFAKIAIWNAALTTTQVDAEFSNRALQLSTNCVFYNDCTSAANIGVDGSPVADNMTVTGTPTDNADDPWTDPGAMVGTSAGAATASATLTGAGALAGTSAGTATPSGTLTGAGAMAGTSAGVATASATADAAGAMTATSAGTCTVAGTLTGTGAMVATSAGTSTVSGTLTATGALAGSSSGTSTVTGTLHDAAVTYEYTVSANGRYFLRNGSPWWENGEWAVQLFTMSLADAEDYLDSCVSHGINSILVELITQQASQGFHSPLGGNGHYPFDRADGGGAGSYDGTIGTADLSTPDSVYFSYCRSIVDLAAERNIRCRLMYMPLGFGGPSGNVDFCQDLLLTNNDTTRCATYGAAVAAAFADAPNVTWMDSSDYGDANGTPPSSTCKTRLAAIRSAMESGGCLQLFSYDGQSPSLSTDQSTFDVLSHENGAYTYGGGTTFSPPMPPTPSLASGNGLETYQLARRGWNYTPTASTQSRDGLSTPSHLPCYLQETGFLNSVLSDYAGTAVEVRRSHWWAILSGCTAGILWGDEEIWPFTDTVWQAAMDSDGRNDMLRLSQLMAQISWWLLEPSEQSGHTQLVVGSRGSQTSDPNDYIAAAVASDGTLLLAYVPTAGSAQTFDLDLTDMASGSIRVRAWNPTTGSFTAVATGATNADSSFTVSTPGAGDWVMIADFDAGAIAGTAAGASTASATLAGTGAMVATSAGVATASGTLTGSMQPGTAAGTCTVTGTLTGAGAMAGSSAGSAIATGRLRDVNAPVDNYCYVGGRRFRNFVNLYRSNP